MVFILFLPQAYHPLFVWCAVQLQWPYRLITLALLKSKFMAVKTEENRIRTLKITAMLFKFVLLCLFWRFVPRESGIFEITVGLAQK